MDRMTAMRAFISVVHEGSFTQAAERLETSPQLVSKYVSQLEQHLGVRLLNRTTRRVHLTEAGQSYAERAERLLDELDDLENQLGDMQTRARGLLRISAPVSFATQHMGQLLVDFQNAHPEVGIDLQLNDRKVDILEEGFDIALRIGHLKSSSLIAKRIAPVKLAMLASPQYLQQNGTPQTLENLKEHRYLKYSYMDNDAAEEPQQQLDKSRDASTFRSNLFQSNNGDVLIQAAIAGAGIALQPTFIAWQAMAEGKLIPILEDHTPEPLGLYVVYAHRQLLPSKVRCFIDFIDGYFG
ncbi:MAG: LysR substrate-binding domain-containing protein, partial [Oceanobacter sp.]